MVLELEQRLAAAAAATAGAGAGAGAEDVTDPAARNPAVAATSGTATRTSGAISVVIESGPLGISVSRTNDHVGYAMQVQKVKGTMQELYGDRLQIGMQLTYVNGEDYAGVDYNTVGMQLKKAGRPLTLVFISPPSDDCSSSIAATTASSSSATANSPDPDPVYGTTNWKTGTTRAAAATAAAPAPAPTSGNPDDLIYSTMDWTSNSGGR